MPNYNLNSKVYWFDTEADAAKYQPTAILITDEEAAILTAPPPPTPQEQLKAIEQAIEKHMDEVAQSKKYDNRDSCRLYAGYTNPFQAEAIAFGQWVAQCWVASNQAQADIANGLRTIPTPEEYIAELPTMGWPV
jgi:hypothetical protein